MFILYSGKPIEKSLIHTVESVVIDWSHQVHEVLKKYSAQPLLEGKNPGPLVELDFWNARRADLESIQDQLSERKVVKMHSLLQRSASSYFPAFEDILNTVERALNESTDIRLKFSVKFVCHWCIFSCPACI